MIFYLNFKLLFRLSLDLNFNARATIFPKKAEVVRLNQFFLSDNDLSVPLRPIQDFKGNDKNARMILEFYLKNSCKILVLYKSQ